MKNLFVSLFVFALASTVHASWLYWQVENQFTTQNTGATLTYDTDFYGARLYAVDGTGQKTLLNVVDSTTGVSRGSPAGEVAGEVGKFAVDISTLVGGVEGYSFFIEYVKWEDEYLGTANQVAVSETRSYADLKGQYVVTGTEFSPITQATAAWHGGVKNAPEPTSAVLMLLGVAGLALRRKQRKSAE